MAEDDKQTVVKETDGQTEKTGAEATDARTEDDLDSLLREFETEAKPPEKKSSATPERKSDAATDPNLAEDVKSLKSELARMSSQKDMDATIKTIRGDLDPEVFDDAFMEAWLDTQARNDPRLQRAWSERHANPKQFARVTSELGKNFSKRFSSLPNKEATEDREAVTAAVRGASNKAPEGKPPEYGNLSDSEFAQEIEKTHGFRPF